MDAKAYNLESVFGVDRQLFAPLFQRPYVWNKEKQWELLWDDIVRLTNQLINKNETKPYFMGAIVLEQMKVSSDKPDSRSIIDVQQRLTTLQLLLTALRDYCKQQIPETSLHDSIQKYITNDTNLFPSPNSYFKLWPTNIDREAYKLALTCGSPQIMQEKASENGNNSLILDAYSFFYENISSYVPKDDNNKVIKLRQLFSVIRQNIKLVIIDMGINDDAQVIFETLNARGTPLLPSDLVKNYLFRRAEQEKLDTETLYKTFWESFDAESSFWRGEIQQGRFYRARLDLFLQHYLTLMEDKEIGTTTLFAQYKDFAEKNGYKSDELLQSFKDYSRHFKIFLVKNRGDEEGEFFHKLRILETTTLYPFLLGLYHALGHQKENQNERKFILKALESFLIRRMVCKLTPKNYNRLFLDLLQHLKTTGNFSYRAVVDFFIQKEKDTGRWPNDEEFQKAWLSHSIYHGIKRDRLRLVLYDLDKNLQTDNTEAYSLRDGLTVEHILPVHWQDHCPFPDNQGYDLTPEKRLAQKIQREELKHTIGNLTLLTKTLNPALSNGPFKAKKAKILKHSAINLNRFLYDMDSWDEEKIINRGKDLFEVARKIWPYPSNQ